MLLRLTYCVAFAAAILASGEAGANNCSGTISKLMSKDTEKLSTRYQRVVKRMEKGRNPKLTAEGCRIARTLEPKLNDQISALKESGCVKDPEVGPMVADIVRGHEDDLATIRKASRDCR